MAHVSGRDDAVVIERNVEGSGLGQSLFGQLEAVEDDMAMAHAATISPVPTHEFLWLT